MGGARDLRQVRTRGLQIGGGTVSCCCQLVAPGVVHAGHT